MVGTAPRETQAIHSKAETSTLPWIQVVGAQKVVASRPAGEDQWHELRIRLLMSYAPGRMHDLYWTKILNGTETKIGCPKTSQTVCPKSKKAVIAFKPRGLPRTPSCPSVQLCQLTAQGLRKCTCFLIYLEILDKLIGILMYCTDNFCCNVVDIFRIARWMYNSSTYIDTHTRQSWFTWGKNT